MKIEPHFLVILVLGHGGGDALEGPHAVLAPEGHLLVDVCVAHLVDPQALGERLEVDIDLLVSFLWSSGLMMGSEGVF
jgi:hypothetical protein